MDKDIEELTRLLHLLEERLEEHDKNRENVQEELKEVCLRIIEDANLLEEKMRGEIQEDFDKRETQILSFIMKLNEEKGDLDTFIKQAQKLLSSEWKYEIKRSGSATESFVDSYELKIFSVKVETVLSFDSSDKVGSITKQLEEHRKRLEESREAAWAELTRICNERRNGAEEMKKRINGKLEEVFKTEDARIQEDVKEVKENIGSKDPEKAKELIKKVKFGNVLYKRYSLNKMDSLDKYDLGVGKEASLKFFEFEGRKPLILASSFTWNWDLSFSFMFFDEVEIKVLKEVNLLFQVEAKVFVKGHDERSSRTLTKELTIGNMNNTIILDDPFLASTTHTLKMRITYDRLSTQWSDEAEFTTPEFKEYYSWKECPDNVDKSRKYYVDEMNPRIATKIGASGSYDYCTIIGNTPLLPNKATSWSIKILKSYNNGGCIYIGVAPSDINQNESDNYNKCGWYFYCYYSQLISGPPHNYSGKAYGPRKGNCGYVHTGDNVGVVMDTTKGELSFVVNGVNLGVAYEGIPLEKPLVPCVLLNQKGDSIELDFSETKENADNSISVPSNITVKSITWESITIAWDSIEGELFYQIEVDGNKSYGMSTTNTFTKRRLLPETEHTFRVRAVKGNSVSWWSDAVKGKTQKVPDFSECVWKKYPDNNYDVGKYTVDMKKPRITTRICGNGWYCTIIGNTPIPPNKVTSWSIRIQKSVCNDGNGIFIGVSSYYIGKNEDENHQESRWYFDCYNSTLYPGPPHNNYRKKYGPRKRDGQYVHTGDSVSVVMDTTKGDLSFALNGVNIGVAFEGVPLDKPLVPCVLLKNEGDSVELDTSEVKETTVDSSLDPSNIMTKSTTWDSITLTWDAVEGASFYQIEVDGSKS